MIMEGRDGFWDGPWIWLAPDGCGDKEQQSDSYGEVLNENPLWKETGKCLSGSALLNLLYSSPLKRISPPLAPTVAFRDALY